MDGSNREPRLPAQRPHLRHVLVLVPLGDDEQLGQSLGVLVPDIKPHLPHQVLLVLVQLRVAPPLQDLLQLQLLLRASTAKSSNLSSAQLS